MTDTNRKIQAACSARSEFLLPLLFAAVSGVCIWQARDMSQLGAVFPTTIAVVTLVAALMRIGQLALRGVQSNVGRGRGSTPRRVLLVLAIAAWTLLLPWAGFLLAGLASFLTLMALAQHEPWTLRRLVGHLSTGIILVGCFYGLFALLLNVPLPVGRWFMG
ncbi:tripartite tricarboxylate transporter TctB family protein [Halomonas nitroreducens]|uniref:Tripartite tricarboxylate transporter TctB family protein n=1 Tax=Halomonas nitroreducens TaxID=447425 RepID=A0A3S0HTM8_9GAMM|nr:tripartite tricarboxylate transporter TctB family protein [Halomonas nitroreducens]RTR03917.1 tripartite tricarboxylate transporter TctB family protein [Halomonas nitroreducens]